MLLLNEKIRQSGTPSSEFRGAPFWALTGDLQADELVEQIRNFKKMGLGGFFLHARIGLETEYLSEKWFDLIRVCVEEARKLDMKAYLYDEDRYPSGTAGGLAVKDHPEYRSKRIFLEEVEFDQIPAYQLPENTISIFAASHGKDAKTIKNLRRIHHPQEVKDGEFMLVFTKGEAQHNSWYNGYCYLDTLNKEAVKYFIELTHEQYYKHFKDDFGTVIPAIFCDEPRYGFVSTMLPWEDEIVHSTPWSDQLRENIRSKYGIDIFEYLPAIFFDIEENPYPAERYDYISELTDLFLDSFMKTVYSWCEDHNIMLTGHMIGEDTLATQAWSCGSCMRAYQYFGMPGIDQLGEAARGYQVAKQLSSAARQLGKKHRLTETYGCTGWDFPLAGHKALGDWQIACGINFRCQHLAHYTIRGEAKRDYPASISYQSPWNSEYSHIENYFSRLNLMLTGNEEKRDILLFSPIESAWLRIKKDLWNDADIADFDQDFINVQNVLLKNQLDFDFAEEDLTAQLGKIEADDNNLPLFCIGKAAYKAVVLPSMLTIRRTTVELLEKFMAQGGRVFACGTLPFRLNGQDAGNLLDEFKSRLQKVSLDELADLLENLRRVEFLDEHGSRADTVLYMESTDSEAEYLFAVNTGYPLDTVIPEKGNVLRCPHVAERTIALPDAKLRWKKSDRCTAYWQLDAISGALTALQPRIHTDHVEISISLAALESILIFRTPATWQVPQEFELRKVTLDSLNTLLFDTFEYRQLPDGEFAPPCFVTALDDIIRKNIGIPRRNFMMIQPWYRKKFGVAEKQGSAEIELRKKFNIETLPSGDLFLALEEPELYEIFINGCKITGNFKNHLIDKEIRKIKLPKNCLKIGENILLCRCHYSEKHPGLEAMYIQGDFGVKLSGNDGVITGKPTLSIGDIVPQGMPFYSGNIRYTFQVPSSAQTLQIDSYCGSIASMRFQNIALAPAITTPATITLPPGGGELEVCVCISPRNLFGPFFWQGKMHFCGPDQFTCTANPERQLTQAGLIKISVK